MLLIHVRYLRAGSGALQPQDLAYFRVASLLPATGRRALTVEIGHTDVTLSVCAPAAYLIRAEKSSMYHSTTPGMSP